MAYTVPLLDQEIVPVRATRVTAAATWLKRNFGVARRVSFQTTADATCILANKSDSAEGSEISKVQLSAAGSRSIVLLENYAGNIYVHTLGAGVVTCEYE